MDMPLSFHSNEKIIFRQSKSLVPAKLNIQKLFEEKASNPHKVFKAIIYPSVNSGNGQLLSLTTLLHAQGQQHSPR